MPPMGTHIGCGEHMGFGRQTLLRWWSSSARDRLELKTPLWGVTSPPYQRLGPRTPS